MGKSNNAHYRNADLKRPFDNIKEAMGLTGNADSNYYTNLGKVSRYEGSELDNRKKEGLAALLQKAILGKSADQAYGIANSTGYGDNARGNAGYAKLPGELELQGYDIDFQEQLQLLRKAIIGHEQRDPATFETGEGKAKGLGDQQRVDDTTLDSTARKLMLLEGGKGGPTDALAMTSAGGDEKRRGAAKLKAAQVAHEETKNRVAGEIGKKKTDKIDEEIREIGDRILLKRGLNAAQIMEIRNRALNEIAKLDQDILTEKKRRALIEEKMKTEAEKLTGEKALTSKRTTEAASALTKHWDLPKQLYLKAQKLKKEIRKLQTQNQTEEIKLAIAQKTKQYKITKAKAEQEEAKSKASKEKSRASIASKDLTVHDQKLKDLQTTRTNIIERGKEALAQAKNTREQSDIKTRIARELEPIEIAIKKMSLEKGKADLQKTKVDTRKTIIDTPSPSDLTRGRQNVEARTESSNRSNSGSSTSGLTTDQLINQQLQGGVTPTTRGPATGGNKYVDGKMAVDPITKRGSLGADPPAKAVFDSLMSVDPQVLKTWTPEEIDSAVAMARQQFPKITEARIRMLIQTAQKRSQ